MSGRHVCVVTGTRAEYGQLHPLLTDLQRAADFDLSLLVTGAHLSPEFGRTVDVIRADGFQPAAEVEMLLSSDSRIGTARSLGLAVMGLADALDRISPDLVVVLGDRYEILAAAQASEILGIPLAHIHGGEITTGAFDDAIRHAISKFASLHFTAAAPYRQRVIQMGAHPDTVHNVGAPALDAIDRIELLSRQALEADLGLPLGAPLFLATYHPSTAGDGAGVDGLKALLQALDQLPEATVIWTYPNADAGSRELLGMAASWVDSNPERSRLVNSLGARRYLSLLALSDAVIGNSSSGLTEAPFLRTATVNVGDRQNGRIRSASVVDVSTSLDEVLAGLRKVLEPEFPRVIAESTPAYGDGHSVERILSILRDFSGSRAPFFDIEHDY